MKKNFLETGKIINTHGVKGEMKVQSLCDSPCDFLKIDSFFWDENGTVPAKITQKRLHGEFPLITVEGIDTVQAAALKKNKFLYSPRCGIPVKDGKNFIQDIIGLPVFHTDTKERLGTVCDVIQNTAQTVFEIDAEDGKKVYVPNVKAFIIEIDTDSGVYIRPIGGMFSEDAYEV